MNATLGFYYATLAAMLTLAWLVGIEVGQVIARREARRNTERRQVLSQINAVQAVRR